VAASSRFVAIALVVVLAGASVLAVLGNSGQDSPTPPPSGEPSPATGALYVSGDTLQRVDLDSGEARAIGRTPTNDLHASPSTPWIAYVVSGDGAEGEEDILAEPELRTINLETGVTTEIGPGFRPLWHPIASRFAYLRPLGGRRCSGESCSGLLEVVVHDADTQETVVLTEPGRFNPLAWSGPRLLVADESDLSATLSLGMGTDVERLEIEPSDLWGASPDGRWILRSVPGAATLMDLESGAKRNWDVSHGVLAEGAWSPDSKQIVAAVLNEARTKTRAVLIDVPRGGVREITSELPGIIDITWDRDASRFGFLTFVGRSNRTELNVCSSEDGRCETVGQPLRRALLLRFE